MNFKNLHINRKAAFVNPVDSLRYEKIKPNDEAIPQYF